MSNFEFVDRLGYNSPFNLENPDPVSGFKNSPFGQFWETAIYNNEEVLVNYKPLKVKFIIAVNDNKNSIKDKYKNEIVENNVVKLYLIVNDKKAIDYSPTTDLRTAGIRYTNITEFVGVVLGDDVFKAIKNNKEKQKEYVNKLVQDFLENTSQEKPLKAILNRKFTFYMNNKRSSLFPLGNIGNLIQQELKKDLQQVWKPILNSLAKEIRSYKLEDEKYWQPYTQDGTLKNNKNFTPLIGANARNIQEFSKSFLNSFNAIDVLIQQRLNFNGSSQKPLENALEKIYTYFKSILNSFKKGILIFIDENADRLYELNAFLIGIINGIIELVASLVDLVGFTAGLASGDAEILWQTVLDELKIIQEKGGFVYIIEKLNELFEAINKRYDSNQTKYKILKNLGEDIFGIIELVIGAIAVYKIGKVVLKATKKGYDTFKKNIDDVFGKHKNDFDNLINKRVSSYLSKTDYDKFIKQQKWIDDVETGKKKIDTGEKPDGEIRSNKDFTLSGNYGEMKADQFMFNRKQRWKPLHNMIDDIDKKHPSGIDGIYKNLDFKLPSPPNPPKYVIAEAKFSLKGNAGLSTKKTRDGLQMSDKWIRERMIKHFKNEEDYFDFLTKGYESVLFKINKDGIVKPFKLTKGNKPKISNEKLNYLQ